MMSHNSRAKLFTLVWAITRRQIHTLHHTPLIGLHKLIKLSLQNHNSYLTSVLAMTSLIASDADGDTREDRAGGRVMFPP